MRALYLDVTTDYSTDSFLLAFRRFVTIQGYPKIMYSDRGSQLLCSSDELERNAADFDWERVEALVTIKGLFGICLRQNRHGGMALVRH